MSDALKTAIYNRLTGIEVLTGKWLTAQQTLAGLLAIDPDTTATPAVFASSLDDAPVAYPCVTFRLQAGSICRTFRDGSGGVDEPVVDLEIWNNTRVSNVTSKIADQIYLLLDDRAGGPSLPMLGGTVVSLETFVPISDLMPNPITKSWFALWRFAAVEGR